MGQLYSLFFFIPNPKAVFNDAMCSANQLLPVYATGLWHFIALRVCSETDVSADVQINSPVARLFIELSAGFYLRWYICPPNETGSGQ
jgi:hypothetical protein